MGLDMYLSKQHYITDYDKTNLNKRVEKITIKFDKEYDDGSVEKIKITTENPIFGIYVETPVMYWRKMNAIHKYFLDAGDIEEDKCQKVYLSGEDIRHLVEICKEIMEDHSKAEELLPTQAGFFFGSTEYDEYYFDEIERTYNILKDMDMSANYVYQASW